MKQRKIWGGTLAGLLIASMGARSSVAYDLMDDPSRPDTSVIGFHEKTPGSEVGYIETCDQSHTKCKPVPFLMADDKVTPLYFSKDQIRDALSDIQSDGVNAWVIDGGKFLAGLALTATIGRNTERSAQFAIASKYAQLLKSGNESGAALILAKGRQEFPHLEESLGKMATELGAIEKKLGFLHHSSVQEASVAMAKPLVKVPTSISGLGLAASSVWSLVTDVRNAISPTNMGNKMARSAQAGKMLTDGFFRSDCYVKIANVNSGNGVADMVNFLKDINIADQRVNSTFADVNSDDLLAGTQALAASLTASGGADASAAAPAPADGGAAHHGDH
jgi:hypothetical protein